MEYRNLGRTGLKVSEVCLGTMQFGWTAGEEEAFQVLNAAVDAGINFLDTANVYSRWVKGNSGGESEKIIGNWMKKSGTPRADVVIATKVRASMGPGVNDEGLSRVHILKAIEDTLRRLQTDYIDLYQTHWTDDNTPIRRNAGCDERPGAPGKGALYRVFQYPSLAAGGIVVGGGALPLFTLREPAAALQPGSPGRIRG